MTPPSPEISWHLVAKSHKNGEPGNVEMRKTGQGYRDKTIL
jgi:hypothetical protein